MVKVEQAAFENCAGEIFGAFLGLFSILDEIPSTE